MRKKRKRKDWLFPAVLVIVLLAAAAALYAVFYVPDENIEIVGNTRYKENEIIQVAIPGFIHRNTLYLKLFRKTVVPEDVPFVNSIDVEYVSRDQIRLHVNEDYPIGYILQDGSRYYFDAVGLVIERLDDYGADTGSGEPETAEAASGAESAAMSEAGSAAVSEAESAASTEAGSAVSSETGSAASSEVETDSGKKEEGSGQASLEAEQVTTADTAFRPAVTDVSPVTGLTGEEVVLGEIVPADDPAVFPILLTLNRMISKFEIPPDRITVGSGMTLSLQYGKAEISLGTDHLLEEKMTKAAAILPQIRGAEGILHLENYEKDTVNIIFEQLRDGKPVGASNNGAETSSAPIEKPEPVPEETEESGDGENTGDTEETADGEDSGYEEEQEDTEYTDTGETAEEEEIYEEEDYEYSEEEYAEEEYYEDGQ